jgi:SOS response regulatory protein OraA/RecX
MMKPKDRKSILSLYVSTKLISLLDTISDRHAVKVSKLAEKLLLEGLKRDEIDLALEIDDDDAIEKITTKIIRKLDHGEK